MKRFSAVWATFGLVVMVLLRSYRGQGSLIAVTHNPEILSAADLVYTMREGRITSVRDWVSRAAAKSS